MPDYPSNSDAARASENEKIRLSAAPVIKKKTQSKIARNLFSEDIDNVKSYIFQDVIIPKIKDIICYTITDAVQMLIWGEAGDRYYRGDPRGRDPYRRDYNRMSDPRPSRSAPPTGRRTGRDFNLDEIYLKTRGDADVIIDRLLDDIEHYKIATVANLYDYLEMAPPDYTASEWGWYDLSSADVVRRRDGYLLVLPRPQHIDNN